MAGIAIRHPVRGQSHRPVYGAPASVPTNELGQVTACGSPIQHLTERVPVEQTAPEDRCKRCWAHTEWFPGTPTREGSETR